MDVLWQSLPYLFRGAVQTVWMSLIAVVGGTVLGVVLGILASSRVMVLRVLIDIYVFLLRGIPILVLMFITYYAFPAAGLRVSSFAAVTFALVLYSAAFYADVLRGQLQAVPRGQLEAARSLGMPRLWIVIDVLLPQALKASIPPWLNISIVSIKSTAYAAIVGAWELTFASKEIVERTLATFEIFGAAMVFYFIICWPLSRLSRGIERRASLNH